jgi:hypothetical protein
MGEEAPAHGIAPQRNVETSLPMRHEHAEGLTRDLQFVDHVQRAQYLTGSFLTAQHAPAILTRVVLGDVTDFRIEPVELVDLFQALLKALNEIRGRVLISPITMSKAACPSTVDEFVAHGLSGIGGPGQARRETTLRQHAARIVTDLVGIDLIAPEKQKLWPLVPGIEL